MNILAFADFERKGEKVLQFQFALIVNMCVLYSALTEPHSSRDTHTHMRTSAKLIALQVVKPDDLFALHVKRYSSRNYRQVMQRATRLLSKAHICSGVGAVCR